MSRVITSPSLGGQPCLRDACTAIGASRLPNCGVRVGSVRLGRLEGRAGAFTAGCNPRTLRNVASLLRLARTSLGVLLQTNVLPSGNLYTRCFLVRVRTAPYLSSNDSICASADGMCASDRWDGCVMPDIRSMTKYTDNM
jgi:hypothetical protein